MEAVAGEEAGDGANKRRRCEHPAVDLLSALPDSLLLHILSFLQMEDTVRTALLSRRWRHLWTSTPSLNFYCPPTEGWGWQEYVSSGFIDRALALHEGAKVTFFCAGARPNECKRGEIADVVKMLDSWVRFAVDRGVEELDLQCWWMCPQYRFPDSFFTCESLVSLTLRRFRLDLPPRFSIRSLKFLTLTGVDCNLKDLLSGCPSVEYLAIENCHGFLCDNLCLETAASRLETLEIRYYWDDRRDFDCPITISSPSIKTLVLDGYLMPYDPEDLSSIVSASLDFSYMFNLQTYFEVRLDLLFLLRDLRHVKALELCSWCVQAMSSSEFDGPEFSPDYSVVSLELAVGFIISEIRGIFNALRSFRKLEFLTIDILCKRKKIMDDYVDYVDYVVSNERYSPTMLQHLKIVNIFGLVGAVCAEEENKAGRERLDTYQNAVEFIQFLLKNSPVLERLTISTTENKLTKENYEVLFRFASRLLALPRASPNALVIIQQK